ncbi:DUF4287 domain-containing protein [Streptomyces sp. K1PN6]|uniref:DUF4287 domain-containing protein n=2 Tax=Streptomyces acidicola TaxID=2596892 RepID=A0A5N8X7C4_9ACTN|nr:DUF4287 domain-containing protein [Streptomyces acidicola]
MFDRLLRLSPPVIPAKRINTPRSFCTKGWDTADMSETVKGPASYFPSIEKKYGRPIAEWKEIIRSSPLTRHMELVSWLKTEHGLGHGHANALVAHTLAENSGK